MFSFVCGVESVDKGIKMPFAHGPFDPKSKNKLKPSTRIYKRRDGTVYELTLSLIAKRLFKMYPDDSFCIQATTWSRPGSTRILYNIIMFRIWSKQLNSLDPYKSSVENESIIRAFELMCELKEAQMPRNVENFLKEEKK